MSSDCKIPAYQNGVNAKPECRLGDGRPILRWLDDVEADLKISHGIKKMDN
jgi:hypothetical protein